MESLWVRFQCDSLELEFWASCGKNHAHIRQFPFIPGSLSGSRKPSTSPSRPRVAGETLIILDCVSGGRSCGRWMTSILRVMKGWESRQQSFCGGLVTKSCQTLATPWTLAHQAPLSMGCPRQEQWSVLPFPSPGDLPIPGTEPLSPALQVSSCNASRFFSFEPPGKPEQPS